MIFKVKICASTPKKIPRRFSLKLFPYISICVSIKTDGYENFINKQ